MLSQSINEKNYRTKDTAKSFASPGRVQQYNKEEQSVDPSLIYLTREVFNEIMAIEGGLESIKKELAARHDFTLAGAFNMFTGYSQTRLSVDDLVSGVERLGVVASAMDMQLFVERYDSDRDGKLGFWELSNALMPIDSIHRDDLERRKAVWDLGYETKEILRRVFRKLIDAEAMLESIRQRISREKFVSLRKAFDSLDWLGRGFLTSNEFKKGFEEIGSRQTLASVSQSIVGLKHDLVEIEGMIRRFNKDKLNGRVSINEFLDELSPKCAEKPF
jgi:Ca2+-binding EF-hand superfamily protein